MRRTAAATMAAIALVVGPALATSASAVPMSKCNGDAENFQVVNGKCVSDGQAERLGDSGGQNESESETEIEHGTETETETEYEHGTETETETEYEHEDD